MNLAKFKNLELILVLLIALFSGFLYTFKLGETPPGAYIDEAGTGYNAYSILKTGKDENGKTLPIAMRLFGSYSPPLYTYLTVPIIAVFDLNAFSTRLLSAICGVLSVFVIYFLLRELNFLKSRISVLLSVLFFSITPWWVYYSRVGYEMNLAFLFFSVSLLLILRSVKNPKLWNITLPIVSLTTYTDWGQRIHAPLLLLGILFLFRKSILNKKIFNHALVGIITAVLIQIPNLFILTTESIHNKNEHFYSAAISLQAEKITGILPWSLSLVLAFFREFLSKFTTYFSPRSLFFLPDSDPQISIPELSTLYPWMIIPYLLGLYFILKNYKKVSAKIILFLFLIAPLPASLTKEPFHIQRALIMLLPLTLTMAYGIDKLIEKASVKIWLPISLFLFFVSMLMFWRSYFIILPHDRGVVWGKGFVELAKIIKEHPNDVFIIDQSIRTRPQDVAYTQMAFHLKIPPNILHSDQPENTVRDYYNLKEFKFHHKLGNIEAKNIDWGESVNRDVIFVGDLGSVSDLQVTLHNLKFVFEIKDANEQIILRGFRSSGRNIPKKP